MEVNKKERVCYAVYDDLDNLEFVGTVDEVCKFMGIQKNSFYSFVARIKHDKQKHKRKVYRVEDD
jgi:hypothetical protein